MSAASKFQWPRTRKCTPKHPTRCSTRAITQFFFDADNFLRFRDLCHTAGITAPIVPGILPITKFSQMQRFAAMCGASVPAWLHERFAGLDEDDETRRLIAANTAIELVTTLQRHGVEDFHFYTLNRAELTYAICYSLGLRPQPAVAEQTPPAVHAT